MATFVVFFRGGPSLLVEGEYLERQCVEGSDTHLIIVQDQGRKTVAILPSDAVSGVYRQDAAKFEDE